MARKISSKKIALHIAKTALDKQARQIVIIYIADKVDYADYLVVCSGSSRRHVKSISESIEKNLKRRRIVPLGIEGESEGNWILLDYGVVVAHVFLEEVRQHYDIDGLWLDAMKIELEEEAKSIQ